MSSRFKPVLLCVIVSLIFTACFPTGYKETKEKNGKQEELSIEELNSSENESISYDFDMNEDYPEECGIYSVEYRPWDEEKVRRVFFGSDDKGIYSYEYHKKSEYVEDKEEEYRHFYELEDGRRICCDAGQLSYSIYDAEKEDVTEYGMYPSVFSQFRGDEESIREWLPEENLQSFSVENGKKRVEEIITELDLPVDLNKVQIYAINAASHEWMEQNFMIDMKKLPDAYMLVYPVGFEEVCVAPISEQWNSALEVQVCGSYVVAVFTENRLEYFEFCKPISKGNFIRKETIYSKMQAIMAIKEHMNSMSVKRGESCKISGGVLQYVYMKKPIDMTGQFEIKPYWIFYQTKKKPDGMLFHRSIFVDAVTGQIFE